MLGGVRSGGRLVKGHGKGGGEGYVERCVWVWRLGEWGGTHTYGMGLVGGRHWISEWVVYEDGCVCKDRNCKWTEIV